LQPEDISNKKGSERNNLNLLEGSSPGFSLSKEPVEVPEQNNHFSLTETAHISLPSVSSPVQPNPSAPVNPGSSIQVQKFNFPLPSNITELRTILENYPELLRLMPKHTRVGEQYQAQIPPCTKSSRFKEDLVMGACFDMKTSFEVNLRHKKAMREEMLLKKNQLEKKEEDLSSTSQYAVSLTTVLGSADLEEDDSDTDFNYESAKESNTEKACKAEGIIARRLDCLPGEERDQGSVQYLIRWEDGSTEWEYEELLGEEFGDLIDDYLYREGLIQYIDGDDRETSNEYEGKLSSNFLTNPENIAVISDRENSASIMDPSLQNGMPPEALSPLITTHMKEDALETVTKPLPSTQSTDRGEVILASNPI